MSPIPPRSAARLACGLLVVLGAAAGMRYAAARATAAATAAAAPAARPNPARFYMKIGERADLWPTTTGATRDKIAAYTDLVFIWDSLPQRAQAIAGDLRARRARVGNPGLRILRYWNMWAEYNPRTEASYTDDMLLFQNWPITDPPIRGAQAVRVRERECSTPRLVDISKISLRLEITRVLESFLNDYDGVYFDLSSWNVWREQYASRQIGLQDAGACTVSPFPFPTTLAEGFLAASEEFAAQYHEWMQGVIDPAGDGARLHVCNFLPRSRAYADAAYEDRYLAVLDGCQMDTPFVHQSGSRYSRDQWLWQLETLRRFAGRGRYFLTKIPWSILPVEQRTTALEYGFASYLLGADGRFALFQPAYNFTAWDTDPIVAAPLGRALGAYRVAWGLSPGFYTFSRAFERGMVIVNADKRGHTVQLPPGTYTDALRGTRVKGKLRLPAKSARLLLRSS